MSSNPVSFRVLTSFEVMPIVAPAARAGVHPLHARVEVVLHGCQAADWIGVLDRRDIADGLVLTEKFLVSQA